MLGFLRNLWQVDDDIAAAWELLSREPHDMVFLMGSTIQEPGVIGRLLRRYPTGIALSPSGAVFAVLGVGPKDDRGVGTLQVKLVAQHWSMVLAEE